MTVSDRYFTLTCNFSTGCWSNPNMSTSEEKALTQPQTEDHFSPQAEAKLYQQIIAEKDKRIAEKDARIAELATEVEKHQKHWWRNDWRTSVISFLVGACLNKFWLLVEEMYRTRTASFLAFCFVATYAFLVFYFLYRGVRGLYVIWRAAAKISPVARYGAQCVMSQMLGLAVLAGFIFSRFPPGVVSDQDAAVFYWMFPIAAISAVYNYFQMKTQAQKRGEPNPTPLQMLGWTFAK